MLTDTQISRLYALCPIWLWPVLAFCVPNVREQLRLLKELGCTGWEVSLTGWGRPYISRVYWPDEAPRWDDALYRAAMGEPVETPKYTPKPTGLFTAEDQVDWLLGTGWIALGLAHAASRSDAETGAKTGAANPCRENTGTADPNTSAKTARAPPGHAPFLQLSNPTDAAPAPAAEGAGCVLFKVLGRVEWRLVCAAGRFFGKVLGRCSGAGRRAPCVGAALVGVS